MDAFSWKVCEDADEGMRLSVSHPLSRVKLLKRQDILERLEDRQRHAQAAVNGRSIMLRWEVIPEPMQAEEKGMGQ